MTKTKLGNKRGSPEAVAKRRAARALNRLFEEGGSSTSLDGRTLKRKKRLLDELKKGRKGKPLKALEVLTHSTELLKLGETLTSLRKMKPLLPPTPSLDGDGIEIILTTQDSYGFDPRAWKLLGVDLSRLAPSDPAREREAPASGRGKRGRGDDSR